MTREQIKEFTFRTTQENHSGLILVLFDVEKVYVNDALEAYEKGDEATYLRYMELAKKTHNELMSCINPKDELGRKVLAIFRFVYGKLVSSAVKRKPEELDRISGMMDNLRESFVHVHKLDKDGPVMKNTHQVYAGLTYGKGVLNESIQTDLSSRGFKA